MHVFVLFGQPKERFPGEFAPEALGCATEYMLEDSPNILSELLEQYKLYGKFESLRIVPPGNYRREIDGNFTSGNQCFTGQDI